MREGKKSKFSNIQYLQLFVLREVLNINKLKTLLF